MSIILSIAEAKEKGMWRLVEQLERRPRAKTVT